MWQDHCQQAPAPVIHSSMHIVHCAHATSVLKQIQADTMYISGTPGSMYTDAPGYAKAAAQGLSGFQLQCNAAACKVMLSHFNGGERHATCKCLLSSQAGGSCTRSECRRRTFVRCLSVAAAEKQAGRPAEHSSDDQGCSEPGQLCFMGQATGIWTPPRKARVGPMICCRHSSQLTVLQYAVGSSQHTLKWQGF